MKLIRCRWCGDVVCLYKEEWRKCLCKASGGQYNEDNQTVTVGGKCEVIGIRNDYFDYEPFTEERNREGRNVIIQGEYEGDKEVKRVKSSRKPRKKREK